MDDDLGVPLFQETTRCSMDGCTRFWRILLGEMLVNVPDSIWVLLKGKGDEHDEHGGSKMIKGDFNHHDLQGF